MTRYNEVANVRGWRIASVDRTVDSGPWIRWWGPNNGGYDDSLDHAGVYELDVLLASRDYYSRHFNLCVPDYVARRLAGGADRAKNIISHWEVLWFTALFRSAKPRWPAAYDPTPVNNEAKLFNKKFPVGSLVRIVLEDADALALSTCGARLRARAPGDGRVSDIKVVSAARNVDDRAMVRLAGLGAVRVSRCCNPATTCPMCGDDLLSKWLVERYPEDYVGKNAGDCRSCPASGTKQADGNTQEEPRYESDEADRTV